MIMKVEWSFATTKNGEQSVVIGGGHLMLELSADSLASPLQVYLYGSNIMHIMMLGVN